MIGIIVRYGTKLVFCVGPTRGYCEEIALALFAEEGIDLTGVELPLIEFPLDQAGGVLIDPTEPDEDEGDPMEGWSLEGWAAPPESDPEG
tara:strand:- start:9345 stop:9614 length:270 start_codon:yes stop_codon:yes gene_type:complete